MVAAPRGGQVYDNNHCLHAHTSSVRRTAGVVQQQGVLVVEVVVLLVELFDHKLIAVWVVGKPSLAEAVVEPHREAHRQYP